MLLILRRVRGEWCRLAVTLQIGIVVDSVSDTLNITDKDV